MSGRRRVLFLQGMANLFFTRLGAALRARGHAVHRVNFSGGDRLFWRLPGAIDYRGRLEDWPAALAAIIRDRSITDIVLFGDCRPLHRSAIAVARSSGVPVHVCEEGYLRPGFVTFETGGVNGNSTLPRDPRAFLDAAARLPPPAAAPRLPSSFARRAWEDFSYTAADLLLGPLYPNYRTYRARHPLVEYVGWSRKIIRHRLRRRHTARAAAALQGGAPYFLLPLQLDRDTQVRHHSSLGGIAPMLRQVVASFAADAPPGARLVVKEHPLDDGLTDWRSLVRSLAEAAGVSRRVLFLERGDIAALTRRAAGVLTINSSVGMLALSVGVPVFAFGFAIYDLPGLTHAGPLEGFWTAPAPPDPALFRAFHAVLADRCLLTGGFYGKAELALLVQGGVARLEAPASAAAWLCQPADDRVGSAFAAGMSAP